MTTASFWEGRKVFLTGHTGFKGSWLALWLQEMGAVVHGYALAPDNEDAIFILAHVAEGMRHQIADVRDGAALKAAIRDFGPEIVIHMAAQSLVHRSYHQPVETYDVNVMGTVNLLEAVRACGGVRATLIVTSDKCYENDESGRAFRETDPMGGHDPYSSSKGCAELVTSAYARSFADELGPLASVRAGNVVGGGDVAENRILPDVFRALLAGGQVVLRNPQAIRPWQHVLEPLSGYLAAAENIAGRSGAFYAAWNFGPDPGSEKPVVHIAQRCCELWCCPDAILMGEGSADREAGILRLDSTKAWLELAWAPRWSLEETLRRTVQWYRARSDGADMAAVTLAQIADYQQAS